MRTSIFRSVVLFAAVVFGLSACNTMEGLGKDIKQAGQSLESAADRKK